MLVRLGAPPGAIAVDLQGRPRFWATAWEAGLAGPRRSANTVEQQQRHLDTFYNFCDAKFGRGALDAALSGGDALACQDMVERFHLSLTSTPDWNSTAVQCWDVVRRFMSTFARRWMGESELWLAFAGYLNGLPRLRAPKTGRFKFARALPDRTLAELLEAARPDSRRNPFSDIATRWRNWLVVNLLLLCGLRRGESLLLQVSSLHSDVEPATGQTIYWIDVTTIEDDEDERATRPSIKTEYSHRQVPISRELADLWERVVSFHRKQSGRHDFLLTSRDGLPLSAESVTKLFAKLTGALSEKALTLFKRRTGGKENVSAHDLRHTCATVRYTMFLKKGNDRELALQRMRAFFGWSYQSNMPEVYARASIHDDLLRTWDTAFESRLAALRKRKR